MKNVTEKFDRRLLEETICKREISTIADLMESAFGRYRGDRGKIDQVLYVGEVCRMPKIKEMMKCYLSESCFIASDHANLDQSEVVAKGAAIIASQANGSRQFGPSFAFYLIFKSH